MEKCHMLGRWTSVNTSYLGCHLGSGRVKCDEIEDQKWRQFGHAPHLHSWNISSKINGCIWVPKHTFRWDACPRKKSNFKIFHVLSHQNIHPWYPHFAQLDPWISRYTTRKDDVPQDSLSFGVDLHASAVRMSQHWARFGCGWSASCGYCSCENHGKMLKNHRKMLEIHAWFIPKEYKRI